MTNLIKKVGLEEEYTLADLKTLRPASEQIRDRLANLIPFAQQEMGTSQIETISSPIKFSENSFPATLLQDCQYRKDTLKNEARRLGVFPAPFGLWPLDSHPEIQVTCSDKHQNIFNSINSLKRRPIFIGRDSIFDVSCASMAGLTNGIHINLELRTTEEAIHAVNHAMSISCLLIALGANSRFLYGRNTGMAAARLLAYEASVTIDPKNSSLPKCLAGLPDGYFADFNAYAKFASPAHFINGQTAIWNDVRLKNVGNKNIVEIRYFDTQTTAQGESFLVLLCIGLLADSIFNSPLKPWQLVQSDRSTVIESGINSSVHFFKKSEWQRRCLREMGNDIHESAKRGLLLLGIEDDAQLNEISVRLNNGTSSDLLLAQHESHETKHLQEIVQDFIFPDFGRG